MSQYLLYSPGVQALLMAGGRQAHDTVGTIAGLSVNQPRLHEAARSWHDASRTVGSVAGGLATAAPEQDWQGSTAEAFARDLRGQVDECTALSVACRDVGDTLASVAEAMGQAHHALVGVTVAAGQSLATLAPGGIMSVPLDGRSDPASPTNPAGVIVDSWRAVCEQLVRHCHGLFDDAAAALDATADQPRPAPRRVAPGEGLAGGS